MDVVDKKTRSRMMGHIRSKNTSPETAIRSGLHRLGYRFSLHSKHLPGRPDLVLTKYNAVIFVHGCFWHRHGNCFYASNPSTRRAFWQNKFQQNLLRDTRNTKELRAAGWRVFTVWECEIGAHPIAVIKSLASFLKTKSIHQRTLPRVPRRRVASASIATSRNPHRAPR